MKFSGSLTRDQYLEGWSVGQRQLLADMRMLQDEQDILAHLPLKGLRNLDWFNRVSLLILPATWGLFILDIPRHILVPTVILVVWGQGRTSTSAIFYPEEWPTIGFHNIHWKGHPLVPTIIIGVWIGNSFPTGGSILHHLLGKSFGSFLLCLRNRHTWKLTSLGNFQAIRGEPISLFCLFQPSNKL